jgi:hypothetical protein
LWFVVVGFLGSWGRGSGRWLVFADRGDVVIDIVLVLVLLLLGSLFFLFGRRHFDLEERVEDISVGVFLVELGGGRRAQELRMQVLVGHVFELYMTSAVFNKLISCHRNDDQSVTPSTRKLC